VADDPGVDLVRDHEHERRRQCVPQGLLDRRRVQEPERDIEIFAVESPPVVVNFAGVQDRTQPQPQIRLSDRRVVLDEQGGELGDQPAEQERLRHVVVRPEQQQHAVAAVGRVLQVLVVDAGGAQRPVEQGVHDPPELALHRVGPLRGALDVHREYRARHRVSDRPPRGRHRREPSTHLLSLLDPLMARCLQDAARNAEVLVHSRLTGA
jgi:hypothetical protein